MAKSTPHTKFDRGQFEVGFPSGTENSFWNLARNWVVDRQLRAAVRSGFFEPQNVILEIGCGTGIVVSHLVARGWNIFGSELGDPTLMPGTQSIIHTSKSAIDLDQEFRNSVRCVLLLDVIEHISDDAVFLKGIVDAFPGCTCFIVTVPARQEVWSQYDEFYGHYRRYDPRGLTALFDAAGIDVQIMRYIFQSLYFAAQAAKVLGKVRTADLQAMRYPALHRMASFFLKAESCAMPRWIWGLSLLGVATRRCS